tara:strand:- start:2 stop:2044 length:2043 start_codon:yes stop_codon:yes gene_type:complete
MCGITGIFLGEEFNKSFGETAINNMTEALYHRGPDDKGFYDYEHNGLRSGFRRLSIQDLSKEAGQPMTFEDCNYVISFNGEIYNHLQIREHLNSKSNIKWNTTSDTETLLRAFDYFGVENTLQQIVGMFAISLIDKKSNKTYLIRDRFGEKPLYFGWLKNNQKNFFAYSSELKSFKSVSGFSNKISRVALSHYFRFMYVPCPYSIYEDIYKLEPGSMVIIFGKPPSDPVPCQNIISKDFRHSHKSITIKRWYKEIERFNEYDLSHDFSSNTQHLEDLINRAVELQQISDVPLGAFLSGGIDSSTIAAIMQQQSASKIDTFTIGFDEKQFDESPYAQAVASHIGTNHETMRVSSEDAMNLIPSLGKIYDEPFADSSQIPTYFVCKAAKSKLTVALSGDAGDELFGGYNRYLYALSLWNNVSRLPKSFRYLLGWTISNFPLSLFDQLSSFLNMLRDDSSKFHFLGDKAKKTAVRLMQINDIDGLYNSLISEWPYPNEIVLDQNGKKFLGPLNDIYIEKSLPFKDFEDPRERMMFNDLNSYLTDDILCKVDRAAMSTSLETRIPFLDHRIVEFAFKIPINQKIKKSTGKIILREILYKYVPRELIDRPKAGFGIPISDWLRGPLREWSESLINSMESKCDHLIDFNLVKKIYYEHVSGKRNWSFRIWSVLMFLSWYEKELHAP